MPNDGLAAISKRLFGERAWLEVVDPATLVFPKKNARFLEHATFDQLVKNVQGDKMLSSVPLCHKRADGKLEVISGTHRVKAAVRAELKEILVMALPLQTESKRVAAQLSHNAIEGQDDPTTLRELWNQVKGIEDRLYTGLDSDMLGQLERVEFLGTGADSPKPKQIVLWFLDSEIERFDILLDRLLELPPTADVVYTATRASFAKLHRMIAKTKKAEKIRNTATAMLLLVEKLEAMFDSEKNNPTQKKAQATQSKAR